MAAQLVRARRFICAPQKHYTQRIFFFSSLTLPMFFFCSSSFTALKSHHIQIVGGFLFHMSEYTKIIFFCKTFPHLFYVRTKSGIKNFLEKKSQLIFFVHEFRN